MTEIAVVVPSRKTLPGLAVGERKKPVDDGHSGSALRGMVCLGTSTPLIAVVAVERLKLASIFADARQKRPSAPVLNAAPTTLPVINVMFGRVPLKLV